MAYSLQLIAEVVGFYLSVHIMPLVIHEAKRSMSLAVMYYNLRRPIKRGDEKRSVIPKSNKTRFRRA